MDAREQEPVEKNVMGDIIAVLKGGNMWGATFGIISLLLSFTIAYNLAKSYDKDGLSAGVIGFASYMTFGTFGEGGLSGLTTGTGGIFVAIIIALLSSELFSRLSGNQIGKDIHVDANEFLMAG